MERKNPASRTSSDTARHFFSPKTSRFIKNGSIFITVRTAIPARAIKPITISGSFACSVLVATSTNSHAMTMVVTTMIQPSSEIDPLRIFGNCPTTVPIAYSTTGSDISCRLFFATVSTNRKNSAMPARRMPQPTLTRVSVTEISLRIS